MHYMEVEIGDGSENLHYQLQKLSNHTIVRVIFTGSVDTIVFLDLPLDADIGDLFELYTRNIVDIAVNHVGSGNIDGTAVASPYRSVLSVRKILNSTEITDSTWLGAVSVR